MQGQHGFHTINSEDHRAWIWVATILSLIYSVLCMAARLVGKWEMLWWDDLVLGLAYVFSIIHYGLLFKAIAKGLGASITLIEPVEIAHAAKLFFASRIFSLIAQCISKISVLIFTRRIFSGNFYRERAWFQAAYTAMLLYGACAVMLSSDGCYPQLSLLAGRDLVCSANIILVVLPVYFISKNTIKNSKKSIIVFIFSFRILVAAFSLATLVAYSKFFSEYTRISIGISRTVAWQEMLLCFSLMTASIPCLRTFLDAFTSSGLMTIHGRNIVAYRPPDYGTSYQTQQSESQSRNAPPTSTKSRLRPDLGPRHSSRISHRLRPDKSGYKANIQAQDTSAQGSRPVGTSKLSRTPDSFASLRPEQLAIHRDVEVRVTHS